MCGLVLLSGRSAIERLPTAIEKLRHRGPDDMQICHFPDSSPTQNLSPEPKQKSTPEPSPKDVSIGFTRLAINGSETEGKQPFQFQHLTSAVNGEIYNFDALQQQFNLTGTCDTHVIPCLFHQYLYIKQQPNKILSALDGFYSGVIYPHASEFVFLLRDYIGKKPLFYGQSGSEIFVASELKSISDISWFEPVPLGISRLNLETGEIQTIASHEANPRSADLSTLITQAVCKRLPSTNQAIGVFLSGGLDSAIVAAIARQHYRNITYYTLGDDNSADSQHVRFLVDYWQLDNVKYVPLPNKHELAALLNTVVYATESYNPSIISNGLATYLLAKSAKNDTIKVVLTGEGADELFSGYHHNLAPEQWQTTRQQLINDMYFTELRRLDSCSMAHGIEARCPFLDRHVKHFSDNLRYEQCFHDGFNKFALRQAFDTLLPKKIVNRVKTSFDVGSGIRAMVVAFLTQHGETEKASLLSIWQQHFSYQHNHRWFHRYPVFDGAIAIRGKQHRE